MASKAARTTTTMDFATMMTLSFGGGVVPDDNVEWARMYRGEMRMVIGDRSNGQKMRA